MLEKIIFSVGVCLCVIGITSLAQAASLADRLSGKILLQVESNGEAWYVNPANNERYFLGRPENAFELMRKLGVGISNKDLSQIHISANSPALPEEKQKGWQTVKEFSGDNIEKTEQFTIYGEKFRILYNYNGEFNFIVSAQDSNNWLNTCSIANAIGTISGDTICYNSGTFYLDVNTVGAWNIEIQEYK